VGRKPVSSNIDIYVFNIDMMVIADIDIYVFNIDMMVIADRKRRVEPYPAQSDVGKELSIRYTWPDLYHKMETTADRD
jgi:hypothetical protein